MYIFFHDIITDSFLTPVPSCE